ncbi:hypothetical protein CJO09_01305 [Neopusillimonas maritima]|uniref:DUF655 domain-containing protein n=2 Tax=Neopusillimonas maritima TaxID=2026239 RepID=A0A3A1YPB0_9BURK|nr:hypothetical protein CJO09_01305 [Neopusillimonas maritima]RIY39336.1 hypothetical protein CJP73_14580 [Neopusillimonas maritima]
MFFLIRSAFMNPFTESTVAKPSDITWREPAAAPGWVKQLSRTCLCLALLGTTYANTAHAVDVNAATLAQLETVKGIGPKTAGIIIQERARGGSYESFEDLSDRVRGIGPAKVAALRTAGLTLGSGTMPNSPNKVYDLRHENIHDD